jgi:hypothetical protein
MTSSWGSAYLIQSTGRELSGGPIRRKSRLDYKQEMVNVDYKLWCNYHYLQSLDILVA